MVSSFFSNLNAPKTKPRINYTTPLEHNLKFGNFGKFKQSNSGWHFHPKSGQEYILLRNNTPTIEPASVSIFSPLKEGDVILFTDSGQGVRFKDGVLTNINFQNTSYKKISPDLTLVKINGKWAALNDSKTNSKEKLNNTGGKK